MMGTFNEVLFEKKLLNLRDTHESIANLSSWCLSNKDFHHEIVTIWLNVLKKVKMEHRLNMFYLANDVIQYSRKKQLPFVESWAPALQKATTMVREDSVKNKILRLFKIWDERGIYDEGFLVDLSGLLSRGHKSASRIDVQDFQPSILYSRIRSCKKLEDDTDMKLKVVTDSHISLTDIEKMRNALKDRSRGEDALSEVDAGIKKIKDYVDALEAEIKERIGLIDLLETGEQYYDKEIKEAKIVVNAYKCFAQRVKGVKRKLEEHIPTLPSPIPSPDVNAPSPSPEGDKEFELPDDTFREDDFKSRSSFLDGGLPGGQTVVQEPDADALDTPYSPPKYYPESPDPPDPSLLIEPDPIQDSSVYLSSTSYCSPTPQCSSPEPMDTSFEPFSSSAKPTPGSSPFESSLSSFIARFTRPPPPPDEIGEVYTPPPVNPSLNQQSVISCVSEPPPPPIDELHAASNASLPPKFPTWNDTPNNSSWESPESPPHFEKSGFTQSVIYDDRTVSQDTDLRFKDVDHRNLISLTGTVPNNWNSEDIDYRGAPLQFNLQDNIENVDMEMSDEEEKKVDSELKVENVDDIGVKLSHILNIPVLNNLTNSLLDNRPKDTVTSTNADNGILKSFKLPSTLGLEEIEENVPSNDTKLENYNNPIPSIVPPPTFQLPQPSQNSIERSNGTIDSPSFSVDQSSNQKIVPPMSIPLPPPPPPPPPPPLPPRTPWLTHPPAFNQPPPQFDPHSPVFNQRPPYFAQRAPPRQPFRQPFRPFPGNRPPRGGFHRW